MKIVSTIVIILSFSLTYLRLFYSLIQQILFECLMCSGLYSRYQETKVIRYNLALKELMVI